MLRLKRMVMRISRLGPRFEVKEEKHHTRARLNPASAVTLYSSYCTTCLRITYSVDGYTLYWCDGSDVVCSHATCRVTADEASRGTPNQKTKASSYEIQRQPSYLPSSCSVLNSLNIISRGIHRMRWFSVATSNPTRPLKCLVPLLSYCQVDVRVVSQCNLLQHFPESSLCEAKFCGGEMETNKSD